MEEREGAVAPMAHVGEALTTVIEKSGEAYVKVGDEIEEAMKAAWKTPDGSPWKFSWQK
jgi:hypothetical protein